MKDAHVLYIYFLFQFGVGPRTTVQSSFSSLSMKFNNNEEEEEKKKEEKGSRITAATVDKGTKNRKY